MVLCNLDLLWKLFGSMEEAMVLWKKLWYYTQNYGTSIYEGKIHGSLPKTMKIGFIMNNYGNILRKSKFCNTYIILEF